MIKPVVKFFVALNGNLKRDQMAAGFSWGLLLGLIPTGNFFWIILFILSFCFRHHHASKLLIMAVIKLALSGLNFFLDDIGWTILHIPALQETFTKLYNTPFVSFTGFNNTLVIAGLFCGIILFLPLYFLTWFFIPFYRNKLVPKIRDSKAFGVVKKLPFVSPIIKIIVKTKE
jgi:uncharacterized protein (TIGR03546 family)